ncbi:uncharacterized protein SAPINGB_P004986 [Magnusiomyces paraingens]|uniref:Sulfiredoxin n=1 Tax=Magnusiomyces paraingens TaxID=2606893 RepID=A0A5E8BZ25_9ASCO|nr:uncharacterized protein SAPINGB_P004986 [Saprochaete ingens]VVT56342.1 unnamed protein product [Saprochaete ingens]
MASIQTGRLNNIMYLRRELIRRPILPVLDEPKIERMMQTMNREYEHIPTTATEQGEKLYNQGRPIPASEVNTGLRQRQTESEDKVTPAKNNENCDENQYDDMTPIDVLAVVHNGTPYYFGFGGCHRFQAYDRAGWDLIKVKIMPATKSQLKLYLGSSIDSIFE